jgi:TonB family protein
VDCWNLRVVTAGVLAAAVGWTHVYGGPQQNAVSDQMHLAETKEMAAALGLTLDYDKPPKAERITQPRYPRKAFDACIEGTVVVLIAIDVRGKVSATRVVESKGSLDEAALACVKEWRFKPAEKAGAPVGTVALAPVAFRRSSEDAASPCSGLAKAPKEPKAPRK